MTFCIHRSQTSNGTPIILFLGLKRPQWQAWEQNYNKKSSNTCTSVLKEHKCFFCHKSFSSKNILKQHERIHTGEKPYKCEFCCESFRQASSLIRHTRTHTGEKPFVCVVCGRQFRQRSDMNKHYITHK